VSNPKFGYGRTAAGNINDKNENIAVKLLFSCLQNVQINYHCVMKSGTALIMATKPYAKENRTKSWWLTWSTLGIALLLHGAIFTTDLWYVQVFFSILAGLTLVRFFVIYHDFMHHSILQKSRLADALFALFGLYILIPRSIWKRSHDHHHSHNSKLYGSSIGSFPIVTKKKFESLSTTQKRLYLFVRHPLNILFSYVSAFILGTCIRSFAVSPKRHWDSLLSLGLHFGLMAILVFAIGWKMMLLGFLLPIVISHALGSYMFYAQHNFPGVIYENKEGWTYIKAALKSSSYMKMSPIMHWFTGNIGYHHIHHVNAKIPFYRLPEAYAKIPELQQAKETSLMPSEIVRCFQLKVWDVENREMVSV
jgi:omega-6 fatty acid desaturase (delta-12 desaturase)